MHALQAHILKTLTLEGPCRFAQVKPERVDSNKFVYHLRALMRSGHIAQRGERYMLTAAGKRYAEAVSLDTYQPRAQPKIVTLVVVQDAQKRYLLYRRRRVPMRSLVGFPYGKIHVGERIEEAAVRELREKAGISAKLALRGHVYLTIHDEEDLVANMLAHIYTGIYPEGELKERFEAGESFWSRIEDIPRKERMPGVEQILRLLDSGKKGFFAEYFLDVHED
jgi:8-oxo-dGTP diphosphatase